MIWGAGFLRTELGKLFPTQRTNNEFLELAERPSEWSIAPHAVSLERHAGSLGDLLEWELYHSLQFSI